jgi:hypothetical protein
MVDMLQTGLYVGTGGGFEVQGLLVTWYLSDMEHVACKNQCNVKQLEGILETITQMIKQYTPACKEQQWIMNRKTSN